MKVGVYKITNPKGNIYIGSSSNLKRRESEYKYLGCQNQKKIYESILKYGWDNHKWEVLEECEMGDLLKKEREYAEKYFVLGANGLNSTIPKIENSLINISEDLRQRMSNSQKGKKMSLESIQKMKAAQSSRPPFSEEAKKNMSLAHKGKKQSKETIKKRFLWIKGKSLPPNMRPSGAKLSYEEVVEIKTLLKTMFPIEIFRLNKIKNLTHSQVLNISCNKAWKNIIV